MSIITVIGIIASVLTSISMLPQLIKIIKNKNVKDVSLLMVLILIAGLGFWVYYGYLINDIIIIIANSFAFLLNLTLVIFIIKYAKKNQGYF